MKRLVKNSVIVILLFGTAFYLLSCKKGETPPTPPVVATTNISDLTKSSALIEGTVENDGSSEITDIGICWSTSPNPTISSNKTTIVSGSNPFTGSITGLTASVSVSTLLEKLVTKTTFGRNKLTILSKI